MMVPIFGSHSMRTVVLVGFMGAGKTSVGRALSTKLGWKFVDLDELIERGSGRTVEQIFAEKGENEFRRLEIDALRRLLYDPGSIPLVIALGGGALAQNEIRGLIAAAEATTVFLDAPVTELYRRCDEEQKQRPLRRSLEIFSALYEQRRGVYQQAHLHIDSSGKDIDTVATEVACSLGFERS